MGINIDGFDIYMHDDSYVSTMEKKTLWLKFFAYFPKDGGDSLLWCFPPTSSGHIGNKRKINFIVRRRKKIRGRLIN